MKRNIYLTALYTVTVLVILFSILGQNGILPIGQVGSAKLTDTIYFDPNGFHSIDMDLSVVELTVQQNFNDNCYITYEASSQKLVPTVEVKDNTLKIGQTKINQNNLKSNQLKLTLSVPAGKGFNDLDFDLGVGDLKFENLSADKLTLQAGVGELDITDSSFQQANIEAGVGDVTMQNCPVTRLTLQTGVGDVKLSQLGDLAKYDLDITVGLGDLSVDGVKKSGFGKEYRQTGDGTYNYKIESGTGDVKISVK
ncbi:MAG: DUF4097 family beta strand repeat protein [Lachnospiraceae bacterium]|nr:DUF4097 family beta strand repeat protein [Lachnospiraceae bacterium]